MRINNAKENDVRSFRSTVLRKVGVKKVLLRVVGVICIAQLMLTAVKIANMAWPGHWWLEALVHPWQWAEYSDFSITGD